jgi:hypothetical protein
MSTPMYMLAGVPQNSDLSPTLQLVHEWYLWNTLYSLKLRMLFRIVSKTLSEDVWLCAAVNPPDNLLMTSVQHRGQYWSYHHIPLGQLRGGQLWVRPFVTVHWADAYFSNFRSPAGSFVLLASANSCFFAVHQNFCMWKVLQAKRKISKHLLNADNED